MKSEWKDLTPDEQAISIEYYRALRLARWLKYLYNSLPLPVVETMDDGTDTIPPPPPPPPKPPF
jgi:hypothetical protein